MVPSHAAEPLLRTPLMAQYGALARRFATTVKSVQVERLTLSAPAAGGASDQLPAAHRLIPCGDRGLLRDFLQRRTMSLQTSAPHRIAFPGVDCLINEHVGAVSRGGGIPNSGQVSAVQDLWWPVSMEDVRKALRTSRIEAVKARLRNMDKLCVPYSQFVEICNGAEPVARDLDQSGAVVVVGDMVILRPSEIVKALEKVWQPAAAAEAEEEIMPSAKELEGMESTKSAIDKEAAAAVRNELRWGLGLLTAQTALFMRLTFWELSWDVMEPICFFTTSFYFMAAYYFFLRTSKEPSFEGYYNSRFESKQRRLMKEFNFDIDMFNELQKKKLMKTKKIFF